MKKTLLSMIVLAMAVVLTACHDDYYDAPFLGTWESIYFGQNGQEYSLRSDEYHRYVFYSDGTGAYTQADGLQTKFVWNEYGSDQIYIRHNDGLDETLYYYFDRDGYLIMSTDYRFYTYYVYR